MKTKKWKPKYGNEYYIPDFQQANLLKWCSAKRFWYNSPVDKFLYRNNLIFETETEAIVLARKMLAVAKGEK